MARLQSLTALSIAPSIPSENGRSASSLSDRVSELLKKIDCKLADTGEQREAIFRLRYQAYRREGAIFHHSSGTFFDPYDEKGNGFLLGLYIDGELASSIRVHVASRISRLYLTRSLF